MLGSLTIESTNILLANNIRRPGRGPDTRPISFSLMDRQALYSIYIAIIIFSAVYLSYVAS